MPYWFAALLVCLEWADYFLLIAVAWSLASWRLNVLHHPLAWISLWWISILTAGLYAIRIWQQIGPLEWNVIAAMISIALAVRVIWITLWRAS